MKRRWSFATAPLVLSFVAGLALWRTLDPLTLLIGIGVGLLAGFGAAAVFTTKPLPLVVRGPLVVVIGAAAVTAASRSLSGVVDFPTSLATFLTVGHPASGLEELACIPALVAFLTATASATAGLQGRRTLSLVVPMVGTALSALLAGTTGVPPLITIGHAVLMGLGLLLAARREFTEMPPLVGSSTSLSRQLKWWQPLVIMLPAVLLAGVASVVPHRATVDVASWVDTPVERFTDDNPLSTLSRLVTDPQVDPEVDYVVDVDGASPGRLRLAVLADYRPEGWQQLDGFSLTGQTLAEPTLLPTTVASSTSVTVRDEAGSTGLRATPTAGAPLTIGDPSDVRYAIEAGVLLRTADRSSVSFSATPLLDEQPVVQEPIAGGAPASLYDCPDSPAIIDFATQVRNGAPLAIDRLQRIESLLKLRRVYDPKAPGGQTLGSVERFISEDWAHGNLEVFATAYALIARCAGVPTRLVVGYPSPAADGQTSYVANQLTVWVEVPFAGSGWVPFDPIPTPAEQQLQAELAQKPPPTPEPPVVEPPVTPPVVVPPGAPTDNGRSITFALAALLGLILLALAWSLGLPALTRLRRRRFARPDRAVNAAWATVTDRLIDRGVAIGGHLTPNEIARTTTGRIAHPATRLMTDMSKIVDHARFDRDTLGDDDAATAWAFSAAICKLVPHDRRSRVAPLRHPLVTFKRFRATIGVRLRSSAWHGALPPESLVATGELQVEIPGVALDSTLGIGSSAAVYRGVRTSDQRPVAVKVFSYSIGNSMMNLQRFRWEANIAEMVSGKPNLPELLDSGLTASGQPYLVTRLYERGTLFRRVQRAGALSHGEVLSIGQAIALALETLHQNTILHGDVKPENIFIDDAGSHILGDLGSAWLRADGGPARAITPPYAAPEVWLGSTPSKQTDIYSLGLTLMFAATGRPPIAGAPPPRSEIEAAMGSDVLLPLLEIDPRRRPRSAYEVARLLGADLEPVGSTTTASLALPTPTLHHHALSGGAVATVAPAAAERKGRDRKRSRRTP